MITQTLLRTDREILAYMTMAITDKGEQLMYLHYNYGNGTHKTWLLTHTGKYSWTTFDVVKEQAWPMVKAAFNGDL